MICQWRQALLHPSSRMHIAPDEEAKDEQQEAYENRPLHRHRRLDPTSARSR